MAKAVEDGDHPCASIVHSQDRFDGEFQPPTPWVGRLSEAPILFIGSNPSIGGKEFYPTNAWNDENLIDFFDDAFRATIPR